MGFSPRNSNDQLFQGTMLISLDSSYAIRKVQMGFSKDINVNFVTDLRVSQEYDFIENEGLMLTKDDLAIELTDGTLSVSYEGPKAEVVNDNNEVVYQGIAQRAFKQLEEVGLIECIVPSSFNSRKKLAREWAFTHLGIGDQPASRKCRNYKFKQITK